MKKELIKFETAKLAKEKGFIIYTDKFYANDKSLRDSTNYDKKIEWLADAPTQSLLQRWLRVEHKLDVIVSVVYTGDGKRYHCDLFTTYMSSLPSIFKTYEEAFEEGLQEALKLIK